MKYYHHLPLVTAIFVATLLTSNLLSSAKIADLGISFLNLPLIFDAGLLVFPLCYIFGDILTEVYGFKNSRKIIWCGFLGNLILVLFVNLASTFPGETSWQEYAGDEAYQTILGGLASGGIVIASLCAYLFGEFSNSIILAKMKVWTKGKFFFGRAIGSTLVGQLLDSAIFVLIACSFGVFTFDIAFELIYTNYLFKVIIEVVLFPVTSLVVRYLKKSEQEDFFDTNTNFNPFRFYGKEEH